jgi:hypothetical protein
MIRAASGLHHYQGARVAAYDAIAPSEEQSPHRQLVEIQRHNPIFKGDGWLECPVPAGFSIGTMCEGAFPNFNVCLAASRAFTRAFEKLGPVPQFKATAKIGEFLA